MNQESLINLESLSTALERKTKLGIRYDVEVPDEFVERLSPSSCLNILRSGMASLNLIKSKDPSIVEFGIIINKDNSATTRALFEAIDNKNEDVIKMILEKHLNKILLNRKNAIDPIIIATSQGRADVVKALLTLKEADPSVNDNYAINLAIGHGHL